jgi:hypothetical protein
MGDEKSRAGEEQPVMNLEQIRQRMRGGFQPFSLRTSDGREFDVPHPEFILIGRNYVAVEDKQGFIQILDPLHIVSLQILAPNRNGGDT